MHVVLCLSGLKNKIRCFLCVFVCGASLMSHLLALYYARKLSYLNYIYWNPKHQLIIMCMFLLMFSWCSVILIVKILDWGEDNIATAAETAALRASFQQEVAVWHKLDHPNIPKVEVIYWIFISEIQNASCNVILTAETVSYSFSSKNVIHFFYDQFVSACRNNGFFE